MSLVFAFHEQTKKFDPINKYCLNGILLDTDIPLYLTRLRVYNWSTSKATLPVSQ